MIYNLGVFFSVVSGAGLVSFRFVDSLVLPMAKRSPLCAIDQFGSKPKGKTKLKSSYVSVSGGW
jgi:hypothetical protein